MTGQEFLSNLESLGVEMSAVGNSLKYNAPEGALTPALRKEMANHKPALLDLLRKRDSRGSTARRPFRRVELSPAQERLWFMDQLVPGSALYNEAMAVTLSGPLNIVALIQALNELVRRHEILRTSIETNARGPHQCIWRNVKLDIQLTDLAGSAFADRSHALDLARLQARRPFNLSEPSLLRAHLVSLERDENLLIISLHHIICDGWSRGVLMAELSTLYDSYLRGEKSPLLEPTIHYSDFAVWQRRRLESGEMESEVEYWRQELADAPSTIDLPTDRPKPRVQTHRGANLTFDLSTDLSDRIREVSKRCQATVHMSLLTAFHILLGRYSSQNVQVVGTVIANRGRAALKNIVGLMVNTVPIKCDLSGDPTFAEMVARVKSAAVGAYKHQELPYERLVAELAPDRSADTRPLIEVMFVMDEGLGSELSMNRLTIREERVESTGAKYDLMMALTSRNGRFAVRIEYNSDLFDEARMRRMAESYRLIVEAIASEPDRRFSTVDILAEAERRTLVSDWNNSAVSYRNQSNVHRRFEEQAGHTPDSVAVASEEGYVTYNELNRRSNQLARALRRRGVGPDKLVGLCVRRSTGMAVGVAAILKAGGAYVPLDPSYPKERLSFMLEDAGVTLLLTEGRLLENLSEFSGEVVRLDDDREMFEREAEDALPDVAGPENLAYVIYTSGSTGKPKGVAMRHCALANLINWHTTNTLSGVRTLQFASLNFDVSFYEIFTALASGGTLLIAPDEIRPDIPKLAQFISDNQIEKAILPVVVLQQLAEEHSFSAEPFDTLKEVTTTGEQMHITRPVVDFFATFKQCSLHNHYGPSESHVVTAYSLRGDPRSWPSHPSIGAPIANSQVYLLDRHMNLSPAGSTGELHIGGIGLARCYLKRPDLTAERLLPNEFSGPGHRLYKTGDLARYFKDGAIAYLGRGDHQVKIRGFRVEPGEIESALGGHAAVREAAVVIRKTCEGDARLAAYVAADRKQGVTAAQLTAFLKERLPDYMVPSSFVIMERLPLTPNGKVDRKALETNDEPVEFQEDEYMSARTPAEELVARIWSEVLNTSNVGINTSFFALGGHSLLATKIILRLREIFRIDVPVRTMFEAPTVAGIVTAMSSIWGGREIVEEIAWVYLQVNELRDQDLRRVLDTRFHDKGSAASASERV